MIGKVVTGKSFRGCLSYCLHDKVEELKNEQVMKDRAEVIMFNQCGGTEKELIRQFNEVRQLNPKLSNPVLHITLSLAPGEKLERDKLMNLCEECAREMGFANNQYVGILHKDTSHQHLHMVVNRIGFDRKTVSDSNSYRKIAQYCRKMELKHDLKQVLSPRQFLSKEQRLIPRQDLRKEQLKTQIKEMLQKAISYSEFEQGMKAAGYQVIKARGISFIDIKKVKIKGSEVGFSLAKIEQILSIKSPTIKRQLLNTAQNSEEAKISAFLKNNDGVPQKQQSAPSHSPVDKKDTSEAEAPIEVNDMLLALLQKQYEGQIPSYAEERKKRQHKPRI